MEFSKWARQCETACQLSDWHNTSTQELMAIVTLLSYTNIPVQKFIWEWMTEETVAGKKEVLQLRNMEAVATIKMVAKVARDKSANHNKPARVYNVKAKVNKPKTNEDGATKSY